MKHLFRFALLGLIFIQFTMHAGGAESPVPRHGIEQRVPWANSRITGSPEIPAPYQLKPAFPKLKFKNPIDAETAPGTGRMYVLEQKGLLYSFPLGNQVEKPDLALDLAPLNRDFKEAYGLTFHPGFKTNHFIYLCYVLKDGMAEGTHVSRFKVNDSQPPTVDPASETVLITWLSGGHNGGCLKFGPDGYFYISTGDGVGPNPPDTLNTGQDISDLLSSILRIDVDHPAPGKSYQVPADNPFVNTPGARPEVWAYGLRNPWKMSFDQKSGELWLGDVGWELWEMVYHIQKGGNYGWSAMEGPYTVKPGAKLGPTPILPPVVSHPHSEAASVTGGFFYYGKRLPELVGAYIYGDWATGKMWALRTEGNRVTSHRELLTSNLQIICFALDEAGELYTFDYAGTAYLLEANATPDSSKTFPRRLSETGLFSSLAKQTPSPGVVLYSVNAEPWADHAIASRLVAFPDASSLAGDKQKWVFPKDAVLAKTLSLEMELGKPTTARPMETQVLHFDGANWQAYSYRWNDDGTDATLVSPAGEDRTCDIKDSTAPGGRREQVWHYHSRAECLRCHNPWAGNVLAYNLPGLNKSHAYGANLANQATTLAHLGLLPESAKPEAKTALANPRDTTASIDARARAYLHVNCAQCHRANAGGSVPAILNYELKPDEMHAIDALPSQGTFGLPDARVIAPGDPLRSVLYYRISTAGQGHMPHIGSKLVDAEGVKLIGDWIAQLPKSDTLSGNTDKLASEVAKTINEFVSAGSRPANEQTRVADQLLTSTSGALALARAVRNLSPTVPLRRLAVARAMNQASPMIRDLFEQFLPDDQRPRKLGTLIKPESILALTGDPAKGEQLFKQEAGAQCQQCHRIKGLGRDFGPDLSHIGTKFDRAQLLDNILNPSKVIDPAFATCQIETRDDLAYSGFIIARSTKEIVLKDANLNEVHIPAANIKSQGMQKISAMPEGLLQNMTAQNAADLIAFLTSLK